MCTKWLIYHDVMICYLLVRKWGDNLKVKMFVLYNMRIPHQEVASSTFWLNWRRCEKRMFCIEPPCCCVIGCVSQRISWLGIPSCSVACRMSRWTPSAIDSSRNAVSPRGFITKPVLSAVVGQLYWQKTIRLWTWHEKVGRLNSGPVGF